MSGPGAAIPIELNGEVREVADPSSLADLVAALGLRPETVAIERNGALVPRDRHAGTLLAAHDRIEIVTLVGGG